jgi:hypothetical protein
MYCEAKETLLSVALDQDGEKGFRYEGTIMDTKSARLLLCKEDLAAPVRRETDRHGVLRIWSSCDGVDPKRLGTNRRGAGADKKNYGRKL